jgi:DNA-binding XRE family transcriptional regulator
MKRLPRILKIISVRNYVIRTLWNNGEVRDIDFKPMLEHWSENNEIMYRPLNDPNVFNQVSLSETHTIQWENVPIKFSFNGGVREAPLDLDPDVLYENSQLLAQFEKPHIGQLLKAAREDAGLSQTQVALNSGTSRTYISRIENERSDIQFDVFYKIVRLGIGKDVRILIE